MMKDSDFNEIAKEIEELMGWAEEDPSTRTDRCIYRIPEKLHKAFPITYSPKVVSIGPFHHGNARLQSYQTRKLLYFKKFIERSRTSLPDLLRYVEERERLIRYCYSENLKLSSRELVKIILVDAGFILGLFLEQWMPTVDDREPMMELLIGWDLCLVENQIPFFVLECLYKQAFASGLANNQVPSLLQLTFSFFPSLYNRVDSEYYARLPIKHFVDLLRSSFVQPHRRPPKRQSREVNSLWYSASKLYEAGLKFEVHKGGCLLDLQFSGGVLKIPEIVVNETTEILFRNIWAFEQNYYPFECYFTDYLVVLSLLIKTNEDVDVLIKHRIILIVDDLSLDAVRNLFDGHGRTILYANFNSDYSELCRKLNAFCRKPWRRVVATFRRDYYMDLKRNYCKTPLQTLATLGGILLLILTVIQTVCSILQVV